MWELNYKESWVPRIDAFELWCWRRLLRVLWTARRSNQFILKEISLNIHWKNWCWSWNSNPLATCCEELTHLKKSWCWEGLKAGGEGDDRGWDGWMASPTHWTLVWVNSRSWWWTGRPGVLQSMGLQRVRHNWVTKLNWTELLWRFRTSCQASQPGDPTKGLEIPRESDHEGQWDLFTRLPTGLGETETPVLDGTNKTLHAPRPRGKEHWLHRKVNQTYLLVLGGPLWRHG